MTKSTSSSENKSDSLIKNKTKLVKAIKSIIDTNGFDYLKNKPYDVYLSLVANKSCSKKVAISVLSSLLVEVPALLLKGKSKSIQKLSSILKDDCCLSDAISEELANVYNEVFSDENKKIWEDNKNSGLKAFLEQKLSVVWDGSSTWECDTGFVYCYYNAKIKVAPLKDKLNTSLIDEKLKLNPFLSEEQISKVYEDDLIEYLDHDFNYYCTADDYYQPYVEDYDLGCTVKEWCKKNGFTIISVKGDGSESNFEPRSLHY